MTVSRSQEWETRETRNRIQADRVGCSYSTSSSAVVYLIQFVFFRKKQQQHLVGGNHIYHYMCILICITLFFLWFVQSPWYNRNGWLGVKHQVIYLLSLSRSTSSHNPELRAFIGNHHCWPFLCRFRKRPTFYPPSPSISRPSWRMTPRQYRLQSRFRSRDPQWPSSWRMTPCQYRLQPRFRSRDLRCSDSAHVLKYV